MTDLLAGITEDGNEAVVDLLAEIDDTGAPAWVPEEKGDGVQGVVVFVDEQPDEYKDGETVPVLTLKVSDDESVRVIGFSSVLRREIRKHDPQKGDTFAVKYLGEKELKSGKFKGKPYKHYATAIRKA